MRPITNIELDFMNIIWEHAPVNSTQLVRLAAGRLGWKKSTTYTVLKKLEGKGLLVNDHAIVTPLVGREEVAMEQGENLLHKVCGGDLSLMMASFLEREPLTAQEARELKALIDRNTREEE